MKIHHQHLMSHSLWGCPSFLGCFASTRPKRMVNCMKHDITNIMQNHHQGIPNLFALNNLLKHIYIYYSFILCLSYVFFVYNLFVSTLSFFSTEEKDFCSPPLRAAGACGSSRWLPGTPSARPFRFESLEVRWLTSTKKRQEKKPTKSIQTYNL